MESDPVALIKRINASAGFNRWCGFEVVSCAPGGVALAMPWRTEVGQCSGFLHAGVVGAPIFTSCEWFAIESGVEKPVATGETLLTVLPTEA